jgi:alanyl-tRNA synthetase
MQQHTGQHLLTAALFSLLKAETVSFHLGERESTIDITAPALSPTQARAAEEFCAERIAAALPVTDSWIGVEEFRAMTLRKKALPDHVEGDIRLVRIGDLDTVHCGGTHVRSTAELHAIKIIGTEKVRETIRVFFLSGGRTRADHAAKHDMLTDLAAELTCAIAEIPGVVAKLREENRDNGNWLKKLARELAGLRASADLAHAKSVGDRRILVRRYDDLDPGALKSLASELTAAETKLLFCGAGLYQGRCHIVCAAGADFSGDLNPLLQRLLPLINGRGGGRGNFAQGAGDPAGIDNLLQAAEAALTEL